MVSGSWGLGRRGEWGGGFVEVFQLEELFDFLKKDFLDKRFTNDVVTAGGKDFFSFFHEGMGGYCNNSGSVTGILLADETSGLTTV